jgi:large subunit ribosomal protein L14
MILPKTVILTMDNSGARRVRCICIYKKPGICYATVACLLLVIVVRLRNRGLIRVSKGQILKCIVTRTKERVYRKTRGYFFKFDLNNVIMLNKKNLPLGTRIFGPCSKELIIKGFSRLASLCSQIL